MYESADFANDEAYEMAHELARDEIPSRNNPCGEIPNTRPYSYRRTNTTPSLHEMTHGGNKTQAEFVCNSGDYLKYGDRVIKNPPLINTSLVELSKLGWKLEIYAKYVHDRNHTKVRYHFTSWESSNAYLTFKVWMQGRNLQLNELLLIMASNNFLQPNFNKVPSFRLMPVYQEVKELDELETLQKFNDDREERLKKLRKSIGTTFEDASLEELLKSA